jgi:hypothetical protein
MIEESTIAVPTGSLTADDLLSRVAADSQSVPQEPKKRGKYKARQKGAEKKSVSVEAEAPEVPEEMQMTPEQLAQMKALVVQGAGFVWQGISTWIAKFAGDEWKSDRQESAEIGKYLALYVEIRFPSVANTPEALLLFAGFGYVSKRLMVPGESKPSPDISFKM